MDFDEQKSSLEYIPATPEPNEEAMLIRKGLKATQSANANHEITNADEYSDSISSKQSNDLHLHVNTQSDSQSDSTTPSASGLGDSNRHNGVIDHNSEDGTAMEQNGRRLVEYDQISEESSTDPYDDPIPNINDDPDDLQDHIQSKKLNNLNDHESRATDLAKSSSYGVHSPPERMSSVEPVVGAAKEKRSKRQEVIEGSHSEEHHVDDEEKQSSRAARSKRRKHSSSSEAAVEEGESKRVLRHRTTSNNSPARNEQKPEESVTPAEKRGRPKRNVRNVANLQTDADATKKRTRRDTSTDKSDQVTSSEESENRQLRKRLPPSKTENSPSKSAKKHSSVETPEKSGRNAKATTSNVKQPAAAATPSHKAASAVTKDKKQQQTPSTTPAGKNKPASAKKSHKKKQPQQQDTYDFDDTTDDPNAMPPLKHVQLARGNFMEMKFTKTAAKEIEDSTPKFAALAQSAEKRRQQSFKSPRSLSPSRATNSGKKGESEKKDNKKDSLTPGQMADLSSFDTRTTGSTMPKSTPSSGIKPSLELSSNEKSPRKSNTSVDRKSRGNGGSAKRPSSTGKVGSQSLFSDVEQKVCDDFDAEDFLANRSKGSSAKQPTPRSPVTGAGRRKRVRVDESTSDYETDDGELKIVGSPSSGRTPNVKKAHRQPSTSPVTPKSHKKGGYTTPSSRIKRIPASAYLTPQPKEPPLPEMTPEQQLVADFPPLGSSRLQPGTRVLAKWADKDFYPGNVVLELGLGRYKVKFVDGKYRDMPVPDLVPVARLKAGDKLMYGYTADDNDLELQPVDILQTPSSTDVKEWYAGIFEVNNTITNKTEKVSWLKFVIDRDQTKMFVTNMNNQAANEIVAENISESRVRRNRGKRAESPVPIPVPERPTTPGASAAKRTPKRVTPRPAVSSSKKRRTDSSGKSASTSSPRVKPSKAQLMAAYEYAAAGQAINEELAENRIFEGLKFVLTSANRIKVPGANESSDEEKPLVSFNKKQMRHMIDHYGGLLVDDFTALADIKDCFLVADQYYRTHKYLSALARAVPCVSHMWIHDCGSKDTKLPHENYMLPAGQSLETGEIVEWHDGCPKLLTGLRVFVYTENRPSNPSALDFVQIWAPLVKCMNAKLLESLPEADRDDDESRVDILLTDISCPNQVLTKAAKLGADAVSSEWLIQAIITGRRPAPNGHPKYRYDYVEQQPPPT